jgi:hypothetical protein
MGDNSGIGGGFIVTRLVKRFAVSAKMGLIYSFTYRDKEADLSFRPGDARYVMLSTGYLLYPGKYSSYSDLNINLYFETLYKEYDDPVMTLNVKYEFVDNFFYMRGGKFVEIRPGVQFILHSRSRIDFSIAYPVYKNTFIRVDPMIYIGYQKYLFK